MQVLPTEDHTTMSKSTSPHEGVGLENVIYDNRFSPEQDATRATTWKILCSEFFQKYIPAECTVLDLGAGDGHFVTNITAKRRIAVDISPHATRLERHGIEVCIAPASEMAEQYRGQVDRVFMSNFLEHLPTKRILLDVLASCREVLRPGGKVIILQPNIRYVGNAYWDYIDHHIALTEFSLTEALSITGFKTEELIPRFLPYTVKSTVGSLVGGGDREWMIRLYLKMPLLWKFLGKQTLVVARV